jgi:hypothetical protein
MTTTELRSWMQAEPFRPFRIRMADGTSHDVPSPDIIGCGPSGRTCAVYGAGDDLAILDLRRVTPLEQIP